MIKDICDMSEIGEFKDHIRGLIPDVAIVCLQGRKPQDSTHEETAVIQFLQPKR